MLRVAATFLCRAKWRTTKARHDPRRLPKWMCPGITSRKRHLVFDHFVATITFQGVVGSGRSIRMFLKPVFVSAASTSSGDLNVKIMD